MTVVKCINLLQSNHLTKIICKCFAIFFATIFNEINVTTDWHFHIKHTTISKYWTDYKNILYCVRETEIMLNYRRHRLLFTK